MTTKKLICRLSLVFVLLFSVIGLASCSQSVYSMFKNEGIVIPKDNVYQLISEDELVNKIDNETEMFYVFYGKPSSYEAKKAITTVDTQAKQFNVSVIYFLDATPYNSASKRAALQEKIKIKDASSDTKASLIAYKNGIIFDGSRDSEVEEFKGENGIDYNKLCAYLFRDLPNEKTES